MQYDTETRKPRKRATHPRKIAVTLGLAVLVIVLSSLGRVQCIGSDGEQEARRQPAVVTAPSDGIAVPVTSPGLGVTRERLQASFEEFGGYRFESTPSSDGRSRTFGNAPYGKATLEIIGPSEDVTEVWYYAILDRDNSLAAELKKFDARLLMDLIAPDWSGRTDWFDESVEALTEQNGAQIELRTQWDNKTFSVEFWPERELLFLIVSSYI